jgi:hypothetical protein
LGIPEVRPGTGTLQPNPIFEGVMTVSSISRIRVLPDSLVNEAGGESIVLNLRTGAHYALDEVGTRMWTVLASSGSIENALDELLSEYDVDEVRLRGDLQNLAANLAEIGLVEVRGG